MKKILIALVSGSVVFAAGCNNGVAQEKEESPDPAVPVEIFACKYNEGMGPADLDAASAKWNAWADERGLNDYTAWTLTKYYFGPEQDFDVLWLGFSSTAKTLGAAQDNYLANGGEIAAGFAEVVTCSAHANFASVQFQAPPEREDPDNIVISFSDCNIAEGKSFDDVEPAIRAWAEYRAEEGSDAGRWILFPSYGGGDEDFDYKSLTAHQNLEAKGVDWDAYAAGGYKKAQEIFQGLSSCDSSRVYNATNRRRAVDNEE